MESIAVAVRRLRWAVIGASVAAVVLSAYVPIRAGLAVSAPNDDAYITLCYARSIGSGEWFRASSDAPLTLGTTTPLFALLLGAIHGMVPALPLDAVSIWFSVACWLGTAFLVLFGGRSLGLGLPGRALVATLICADAHHRVFNLGMETWLFVALLTGAALSVGAGRWRTAGTLVGLSVLARPEGVILLALLAVVGAWQVVVQRANLRHVGGGAICAAVPLAVWCAVSVTTIGTAVPTTIAAKHGQTIQRPFLDFLGELVSSRWRTLPGIQVGDWELAAAMWLGLAAVGFVLAVVRRNLSVLLLGAWAGLTLVGYGIGGAPAHPWYAIPVLFVIVFAGGYGVAAFLGGDWNRRYAGAATALAAIVLLALIVGRWLPDHRRLWGGTQDYERLAAVIDESTLPGGTAAFVEVGALQWFSERRVVDLMGLISPELLPAIAEGELVEALKEEPPDIVVVARPFMGHMRDLLSSAFFARAYEPIEAVSSESRFRKPYQFFLYRYREEAAERTCEVLADLESEIQTAGTPRRWEGPSYGEGPVHLELGCESMAAEIVEPAQALRFTIRSTLGPRTPVVGYWCAAGEFSDWQTFIVPLEHTGRPERVLVPASFLGFRGQRQLVEGLRVQVTSHHEPRLVGGESFSIDAIELVAITSKVGS